MHVGDFGCNQWEGTALFVHVADDEYPYFWARQGTLLPIRLGKENVAQKWDWKGLVFPP